MKARCACATAHSGLIWTRVPQALLLNLVRDDCFMRQWQTGRAERTLVISCTPDMLRAKGLLRLLTFLEQYLRWQ